MAFNERNLDDYVTVAERIQEFYAKYPDGSLQAANPESPWELALVTGKDKNSTNHLSFVEAGRVLNKLEAAP